MAAELSAATYRLFANAMHGYGRQPAEQRYLGQASRAYENPLAQRPGGTHLNFNQGAGGPRFDYSQQIAQRYPNAWGMANPGDQTRAAGWAPPQAPPHAMAPPTPWQGLGPWAPQSSQGAPPQIGTWSSQAGMMPPMAPNLMPSGPDRIGGDPRVPAPSYSPNQMAAIQYGNSRTWGPGTSPWAGQGNYPVTQQGQPAPGNPGYGYATNGLNGGWGGLPK